MNLVLTRGEGVQNDKNIADVIYVWSPTTVDSTIEYCCRSSLGHSFCLLPEFWVRKEDLSIFT